MDNKQLKRITESAYKISREMWMLTKHYLDPENIKLNDSDEYWDTLIADYNKILDSLENEPKYVNEMAEQMVLGITRLLEGIQREDKA